MDILRTDHHIYRLVVAKALIHTGKTGAENLHQLIADHDAGYDIALTDEVCHKGILWLVVNEPRVLLLDEPLGALDLKLRQDMQYKLIRLKNELGITFIYVTHDQE